ncbi:unnamed protein product [Owenia fusiformis]|uniref:EGF-like calcium-binding domain-containing protein n=1 Tax=Owenia fusiformis TaxID=6347 RepID=A0A8S4NNM3_OWEFU|nr:unnamed protein product [Owenia fusiformis]
METLCRLFSTISLIILLNTKIPCVQATIESDEKVGEVLQNLFGKAYSFDDNDGYHIDTTRQSSETPRNFGMDTNLKTHSNKHNLSTSLSQNTIRKLTIVPYNKTREPQTTESNNMTKKKKESVMKGPRVKRRSRKSRDAMPTKVPIELIKDNQMETMIRRIGTYLRGYKYLDIDHRFHSEEKKKKPKPKLVLIEKVFMRHFPIPSMRKLHPMVKRACDKGFQYCLQEIYHTVKKTPVFEYLRTGGWAFIKKYFLDMLFDREKTKRILMHTPFESHLAQFQYRLTASYYMCWFTMQNLPELKKFGSKCDLIGWRFKGRYKTEIVKSKDYRIYDREPFDCALLSFCPDFCCGGVSGGQPPTARQCNNHKTNPCSKLPDDKTCKHDFTQNHSFRDLIKNRVNITCNCENYRKGFVWSMRFHMCIDRDECYDRNFTCSDSHHICRNTVGGYDCVCKRGYHWDEVEKKCVRIPGIPTYDIVNASYMAQFTDPTPTEDTIVVLERKAEDALQKIASFLGLPSNAFSKGNSIGDCNYFTIISCLVIVNYVIWKKNLQGVWSV